MTPKLLAVKARKALDKVKADKAARKVTGRVREIQSDLGLSRLPPHPDQKGKRIRGDQRYICLRAN